MAPRTLLLALLLFAGAAGAIWFALGHDPGGASDPVTAGSAPAALEPGSEGSGTGLAALAPRSGDAGGAGADRVEASAETGLAPEGVLGGFWRVPTGSVWFDGRVAFPDGTPLDEGLVVVAAGSPFSEAENARSEMRARVDDQGRFRVAFGKRTRTGRLSLEGRYLYLTKTHKVKLAAHEGEIVLEPVLGGRVVATLLAPAARSMDAGVFEGTEVVATRGVGFGVAESAGRRLAESQFEVGGLDADVTWALVGRSPRFADARTPGVEIEPGGTTRVDLAFTPGVTITGEVLGHQAQPLIEAEVLVMTAAEAARRNPIFNEKQQSATTDGEGRFELVGAEPGDLVLVVEADGHLELTHELGEVVDGQRVTGLRLALDRGKLLAGTVEWPGGEPAAGASVRVTQVWGRGGFEIERVKAEQEVGADGRFEVAALTDGKCAVTASSLPRDATAEQRADHDALLGEKLPVWRATRKDVEPGTLQLVLTLREGDAVAGTVVDDQGEPVERFRVTATPAGADGLIAQSSLKSVRERFVDKRGRFELEGLMPASWTLRVSAAGYGDPEEETVQVPYAGGPLRFVLPRAGNVTGLVVDLSGEPLADARVTLAHGTRESAVSTDEKGRFAAGKLVPGWVELTATADGFGRGAPQRVRLSAGQSLDGVRLDVAPAAAIRGELHPSVGQRADRRITLRGDGFQQTQTDSGGAFGFEGLSAGSYTVRLEAERMPTRNDRDSWILRSANRVEVDVDLEAGAEAQVLLGQPPETAVRVSGRVTKNGEAAGDALVTCFAREGEGDVAGATRVDAEGRYEIVLDEPGEYRFLVGPVGGQATFYATVEDGEEEQRFDFALPSGRVFGTVKGPDGSPLEGVFVLLDDAGSAATGRRAWLGRRTARTDGAGEYSFDDLGPGVEYTVRATNNLGFGGTGAGERLANDVRGGIELEGEDTELRIDLQLLRPGRIEGTVLDPAGAPFGGATLVVLDAEGTRVSTGNERSGASGRFRLESVAPGRVTVYAERGAREGRRVEIEVYEGAASEAQLVLERE